MLFAVAPIRGKARDAKRKDDLSKLGQILYANSCYIPDGGPGDYDIAALVPELVVKYPQYQSYVSFLPYDPKSGNSSQTNYHYVYSDDGHCRIYANLENESEPLGGYVVTGPSGPNGTNIYYQISK